MTTHRKHVSHVTLIGLLVVFETLLILSARSAVAFTPLQWCALAFAASFGGRAIACFKIFEWLRDPFTLVVPHSSGVGECVEARTNRGPVVEVIGCWLSCPLCAGAWVALGLQLACAVAPGYGLANIYVLGAAGLGALLTRLAELLEWAGRYNWELTAAANRQNAGDALHLERVSGGNGVHQMDGGK